MGNVDPVLSCRGDVTPSIRLATEQLIADRILGSAVCSEETPSTNNDALAELCKVGDLALPRLHITDRQTAGRGRQGNRWQSDSDSLTLSMIARFDLSAPAAGLLSIAAGLAVAQAIEFICAPCRIVLKWPNDICMNANTTATNQPRLRKLGGILIETSASVGNHVVIGIGLNLNRSPKIAIATSTPPASLADMLGRAVSRQDLLPAVVDRVLETIDTLHDDAGGAVDQYRSRCVLRGRELSLRQADQMIVGHCIGVADDGALELVVDGSTRRFRSGQVHQVRPGTAT